MDTIILNTNKTIFVDLSGNGYEFHNLAKVSRIIPTEECVRFDCGDGVFTRKSRFKTIAEFIKEIGEYCHG